MRILKRTFKRRDNTDLFTVGNDSLNGGRIMMQVREKKIMFTQKSDHKYL